MRFKQLLVPEVAYDLHTIEYLYDALSRLLSADYYPGLNVNATPVRAYAYTYDPAGNRLSNSISYNGDTPFVQSYTYNAANQISNSGFVYDNNGNLTNDGSHTYTWDRANRLITTGTWIVWPSSSTSYVHDGLGNRIRSNYYSSGTIPPFTITTQYLLDLQPGLSVVLTATQDTDVTRYVHAPMGIHAQQDASDDWTWMLPDGLGSVRSVADNALNVLWTGSPEPYGVYFGESGIRQSPYLFTGEYTDPSTGLVHLRARDYNPTLGGFPSLDPLETPNRYAYVDGNPINNVDPSGLLFWGFPSRTGRESLYSLSEYLGLNRSGTCKKVFAHAWIEYWLEQNNGGIWATHLEFPSRPGYGKVDALTFINPHLQGFPPQHQGGDAAMIFEIEPVIPTIAIASGYTQLLALLTALQNGGFPLTGNLPLEDRWLPPRDITPFSGAPYDWTTYVLTWGLAPYLSPQHGLGPVRISPTELGGNGFSGGIDDAYWIVMLTPGLVLYTSECELRQQGVELIQAAIAAWFVERYRSARSRNYPGKAPLPEPAYPMASGSGVPIDLSDELVLALLLAGGLCLAALAPEIAIPLFGGGGACRLAGAC